MGNEPQTKQEVIKQAIYNGYLHEMMRRLELRGITLHKLADFDWIVYGTHYDKLGDYILEDLENFAALTPPSKKENI